MGTASKNDSSEELFHSSFLGTAKYANEDSTPPKKKKIKSEKAKPKKEIKVVDKEKGDYYKPAQKPIVPPTASKPSDEKKATTEDSEIFHSSFLGKSSSYAKPQPVKPQPVKQKQAKPQPEKSVKKDEKSETDEEIDRKVEEISKNLQKKFEEEEKELRKRQKETKKQEKKEIKRAKKEDKKKRYTPHKKRSIWRRIANMSKYEWGYYEDLEYINPAELSDGEREHYWEDIEELEDAQHDYDAFQAKKTAFVAGIAGVGLAISLTLLGSLAHDIGSGALFGVDRSKETLPPTEIVTLVTGDTQLKLEESRARGRMMKLQDQDYLKDRINDNFIPENVSDEEMLDIMEEAWRTLEPEVQKWVREPYKAHEAELRQAEREAQRNGTSQTGSGKVIQGEEETR